MRVMPSAPGDLPLRREKVAVKNSNSVQSFKNMELGFLLEQKLTELEVGGKD